MARPLVSDSVKNTEPANVLNSAACSVMVVGRLRAPVKNSVRPLDTKTERLREPVRDLPMPLL